MADLPNLQIKIAKGYRLTSAEQLTMIKSLDDSGRVSRRRFTGVEEPPNSWIDNLDS